MSGHQMDTEADAETQRRIAARIRALDVTAPASLHASVRELTTAGVARPRPWPWQRRPVAFGAGGALAAATAMIVALVVALGGGGAASPTVLEASAFALRPATLAPPEENPGAPGQLTIATDGIPYPYWNHLGWSAVGVRKDALHGRTITTVLYGSRGSTARIGYAIVSGNALPIPTAGRTVRWDGVSYRLVRSAHAIVLTWRRHGHTCILAGSRVGAGTLLKLAGWQTA